MKNHIVPNTIYGTLRNAPHAIKVTISKIGVRMTQILDKELQPQAEKIITDTTTKKTDKHV